MNIDQSNLSPILGAICGASIENVLRQPLTAITIVMINQNISLKKASSLLYGQGGIKRFYNGSQGFTISWIMRSTHRISTFSVNEKMHKKGFSNVSIAIAATVAEFVTTAFGELILTISQNPENKATPFRLIKERYQKEGLRALTNGFIGNSLRNIIFNGTLFGLKNRYTSKINDYPTASAALISLIAVVLSHPLEVVRIQKVNSPHPQSYFLTAKKILEKSSLKGFSAGLVPRIYSVGVGTFVMMTVYTKILNSHKK